MKDLNAIPIDASASRVANYANNKEYDPDENEPKRDKMN